MNYSDGQKEGNKMVKGTFSFELLDKYPPEIVIRKALKQIEEATNGYVVGAIENYEGPIKSYTKQVGLAAALKTMQSTSETITVDIQEKLGDQDEKDHKYEVYLIARGLEHYKYRMMFVNYGTVSYPVMIVMNEELSIEYNGKRNYTYTVNSMKELEDMINKVIDSDIIVWLVQNLINESLRQENKEKMSTENELSD